MKDGDLHDCMNLVSIFIEKFIFDFVLCCPVLLFALVLDLDDSSVLSSWSVRRSPGDFLPPIFSGCAGLLEFVFLLVPGALVCSPVFGSSVVFCPPPGQACVFRCKLKGRRCFLPFPLVFTELGSVPVRA
jgi:hypothetical protein